MRLGDPGAERDSQQIGDRGKDEGEQGPGSGDWNAVFLRILRFGDLGRLKTWNLQVRRLKMRRDELLALKGKQKAT